MNAPDLPTRMRTWANAHMATGTIVGVLILMLVFRLWISPWLQPHMGGKELLDVMPWRTPADVDATLAAYGESGRAFYRRVLLVDLLFPIAYIIPLALSVAFAAPKLHWLGRFAHIVPLLPIAGGIFDWGENILFLIQINRFPDHAGFISWIAGMMTFLKFLALISSLIIIACGLWRYRQEFREPSYGANHHSR